MRRGLGRGLAVLLVAMVVAAAGIAAAESNGIPVEVMPGTDYPISKAGVAADDGCVLLLGGRPAGTCGATPLQGTLSVAAEQPSGPQDLVCRSCHDVGPVPTTSAPTAGSPTTGPGTTTPPEGTASAEPGVMPDVVGSSEAEAGAALLAAGMPAPSRKGQAVSNPAQNGVVLEQFPQPGVKDPKSVVLVVGEYFQSSTPSTELPSPTSPGTPTVRVSRRAMQVTEVRLGTVTVLAVDGPVVPLVSSASLPWLLLALGAAVLAAALGGLRWWRHRPSSRRGPRSAAPPGEPGVRSVTVGLSARHDRPLRPRAGYRLWVDIGELSGVDPHSSAPLSVVVHSVTASVGDPVRKVRLTGAAVDRIDFRLRTPGTPQQIRLRCSLYARGSLLQSFLLVADVARRGSGGWSAERDYVTSFSLEPSAVGRAQETVSLLFNHNAAGEHGVFAFFDADPLPLAGRIDADHVNFHQDRARELYTAAGGAPDRSRLASMLGSLAIAGRGVYSTLRTGLDDAIEAAGHDPAEVWARLRGPIRVQVAWPAGAAQPIPAGIVYDYPLDTMAGSSRLRLCMFFFEDLLARRSPRCVRGGCHTASRQVVCPAGFWGFRLLLGCPLSLDPARPIADQAFRPAAPPRVVVGRSNDPGFRECDRHLAALRNSLPGVVWHYENSGSGLIGTLWNEQPSLIYLYCHGGVDPKQGISWVEVGDGDRLSGPALPDEFRRHWQSRPLVFLNGCTTAEFGAGIPNPLARWFAWAGAGGVLGTEIVVHEPVACRFADRALAALLDEGTTVAEAVRAARLELLQWGTVLGLSYVSLAPADLRMKGGPCGN